MSDFLLAALPWVVTGIAIAFVIVNLTRKKTRKSIEIQKGLDEENSKGTEDDNYMPIGMCLGVCFGIVFSSLGIISLSYGTSFGMLIGMIAGMYVKKK